MKYSAFLLLFLTVNLSSSQIKSKPITEISQNDTKKIVLVDVRTPEEYGDGHLDNAVNINWYDPDFVKKFEAIDKNSPIYLYCKMGGRSMKAAKTLDALGYDVTNLEGGYTAFLQSLKKE